MCMWQSMCVCRQMAAAGLVLSFDWLDSLKNNSEVQPPICTTSKSDK